MLSLHSWYLIIHLYTIYRELYIYTMHWYVTLSIVQAEWSDEAVDFRPTTQKPKAAVSREA